MGSMTEPSPAIYNFNRLQWLALALGGTALAIWGVSAASGERLVFTFLFGALLLLLAVIDARRLILPNELNAALAIAGLAMIWRLAPEAWLEHLIGGLAGFALLFLVETGYRALRGREGLGRGDAKLLGAIGLWTSWLGLPSVLLIASGAGLLYGLALIARGGGRVAIPFGPFLALGGWLVWLYGPLSPPL